jgi:hypothetical protein
LGINARICHGKSLQDREGFRDGMVRRGDAVGSYWGGDCTAWI